MSRIRLTTMLYVMCICGTVCSAVRTPLSTLSAAADAPFECGKPNGPCGGAVPEGVKCEKGPGWCQTGYYCGYKERPKQSSSCLPIPANCGTAGNACCPSNTDSPHTSIDDKLTRIPLCKDGSYCFYFEVKKDRDIGYGQDIYAGNPGYYPCRAVPTNCGTGPGTPCCPKTSGSALTVNPPLTNTGCGGKDSSGRSTVCVSDGKDPSAKLPGYESLVGLTGTCAASP